MKTQQILPQSGGCGLRRGRRRHSQIGQAEPILSETGSGMLDACLGRTGLKVSIVSSLLRFRPQTREPGTLRRGGAGGFPTRGVNYFDVAPAYANGECVSRNSAWPCRAWTVPLSPGLQDQMRTRGCRQNWSVRAAEDDLISTFISCTIWFNRRT